MHGFCVASELAYAAVVYLRSRCPDGHVEVRLVPSKSSFVAVVPFVNGLCHLNVFGFPKCTLRTLTPASRVNTKQFKIFHLFSFLDFELNDGLSGSPNPKRNPNLTVSVASFPPRLPFALVYNSIFNILTVRKSKIIEHCSVKKTTKKKQKKKNQIESKEKKINR